MQKNGLAIVHGGVPDMLRGLLVNDLHLLVVKFSAAAPMVKSGKTTAFAVSGERRLQAFPDAPTFAELTRRNATHRTAAEISVAVLPVWAARILHFWGVAGLRALVYVSEGDIASLSVPLHIHGSAFILGIRRRAMNAKPC
jgi:hypothetical protein